MSVYYISEGEIGGIGGGAVGLSRRELRRGGAGHEGNVRKVSQTGEAWEFGV